jgi:hypothetical protein
VQAAAPTAAALGGSNLTISVQGVAKRTPAARFARANSQALAGVCRCVRICSTVFGATKVARR